MGTTFTVQQAQEIRRYVDFTASQDSLSARVRVVEEDGRKLPAGKTTKRRPATREQECSAHSHYEIGLMEPEGRVSEQ